MEQPFTMGQLVYTLYYNLCHVAQWFLGEFRILSCVHLNNMENWVLDFFHVIKPVVFFDKWQNQQIWFDLWYTTSFLNFSSDLKILASREKKKYTHILELAKFYFCKSVCLFKFVSCHSMGLAFSNIFLKQY